MKTLCKIFLLFIFFLFIFSFLPSCKSNDIITTNNYIQTDYEYYCLDGNKTFTQIIMCYQAQDKAEKIQNKLTNEMLNSNK